MKFAQKNLRSSKAQLFSISRPGSSNISGLNRYCLRVKVDQCIILTVSGTKRQMHDTIHPKFRRIESDEDCSKLGEVSAVFGA